MKTTTLTFATLALLSAGFLLPQGAFADRNDDRSGNSADTHQRTATRSAPRSTARTPPPVGTPIPQLNRYASPNDYLNRPLGRATPSLSTPYQDHISPGRPAEHGHHGRGHHDRGHHGQVYLPQPVYYVVPPLFPEDDPIEFGDVRGPDEAVNPDELGTPSQPVVIEADNIYVVSPDRPYAGDDGWAAGAGIEAQAPVRDPDTTLSHHGRIPAQSPYAQRPESPEPTVPQEVTLRIEPADAVVWLDDEELGLAGEISGTVLLEPGVYLLEVEHHLLEPQRLFFGVVDQAVDVRVDLEADEPRRRYRVR